MSIFAGADHLGAKVLERQTVNAPRPFLIKIIIKRAGRRYAESNPDVMADYRKLTFAIRDRLVAEGVLDLPPGETCDVISSPDFLRPVLPTAAYSAPGPLDRHQRGIFYVSDPPKEYPGWMIERQKR